ncbi:MAG: PilZ domain-containing protein [Pseudomonadota bacterium]
MRNYIRHSTFIPIHVIAGEQMHNVTEALNLSAGGLSFVTHEAFKVGDIIDFKIPIVKPDYQGRAVVVWLRKQALSEFEVGVRFTSDDEFFRTRMVEQVCQIEEYRQQILTAEGRNISSEEAALEWIAKYAKNFTGE